MPQTKKKGKIPQKKGKKGMWIKIVCFLLGVAVTLFLIGAFNLIAGNQEEKTDMKKPNIPQEPCKESKSRKNITRSPIPSSTPEVTRTMNIADKDLEVNAEINI